MDWLFSKAIKRKWTARWPGPQEKLVRRTCFCLSLPIPRLTMGGTARLWDFLAVPSIQPNAMTRKNPPRCGRWKRPCARRSWEMARRPASRPRQRWRWHRTTIRRYWGALALAGAGDFAQATKMADDLAKQ